MKARGTCHASDFAHISKGHFGGVRLAGLNVAMVGNLVDANSDRLFATLYLDDKATAEQSEALTRIVEYMNGAYVGAVIGDLAYSLLVEHRYEESMVYTLKALELDPSNSVIHGNLPLALALKGLHEHMNRRLPNSIRFPTRTRPWL